MTRYEELEALLEIECPKYDTNCNTCPFRKECDEFSDLPDEEEEK